MRRIRELLRGIRPSAIGVVIAGACAAAALFAAITVAMELTASPHNWSPLPVAAWGLLLGAVAVLVGFAGTPERETALGKALFVIVAGGVTLGVEILVFGSGVFHDFGIGLIVLAPVLGVLFSMVMALVCLAARSAFEPRTN